MEATSSSTSTNDGKKTSKKKGERYMVHFKEKVVLYAVNHSITEASKHFEVNRTTISDWIREQRKFEEEKPPSLKKPETEDLEKGFLDWLKVQREEGKALTTECVVGKLNDLLSGYENDHWLNLYAKRLRDKGSQRGAEGSVRDKTHIMYSDGFRRELQLWNRTLSKKSIERIFKVSRRRVQEWAAKGDEKGGNPWCKKSDRSYPYVTDEKVDKEVWEWYSHQSTKPSTKALREKALQLYKKAGYSKIQCSRGWLRSWMSRYSLPLPAEDKHASDTELLIWALQKLDKNETLSRADLVKHAQSLRGGSFKASPGWAVRFSKKYARFLQRSPLPETQLPALLEKEIEDFRRTFHEYCSLKNLSSGDVVAFDEIPLHFTEGRKREALIRGTGFESCQGSLILSCLADGTLLPTFVILKGIADSQKSDRVIAIGHEKGVSDEITQSSWAVNVLSFRTKCAVICDSYGVHNALGGDLLQDSKVFQIPPGTNSKLNPINFGLSAAFKKGIDEKWRNHSMNFVGGSVSLPEASNILSWVDEVHLSISESGKETILDAFEKTGLAFENRRNNS